MNGRAHRFMRIAVSVSLLAILVMSGGAAAAPAMPQAVLYDQTNNPGGGWIGSTNFLNNVSYNSLDSQGADDFVVPGNQIWQVTRVSVGGDYEGANGTQVVDSVMVQFYSNGANNLPQTRIYSATIGPGSQFGELVSGNFVLTLTSAVSFPPGHYWFSVQANKEVVQNNGVQWHWLERATQSQTASVWRNPGDGYATGCTSFKPRITDCDHPAGSESPDLLFKLEGTTIEIDSQLYLPVILR
jgi:hypothetical protein